ncbi:MAG: hypothetical protein LBC80_05865 [Treponema sp.]|jgi:hypothetical protein|nr:hypothetical protein [Treponema sp.]
MKKILSVLVLLVIFTTGTAFAQNVHPGGLGIGVMWGGHLDDGFTGNEGAALSLKLPNNPFFWGVSVNKGPTIGVQGDRYFFGSKLIPTLGWYLGLGGYGSIYLGDIAALEFGLRAPLGLTFQPIDLLEIFVTLAPSLGISIITGDDGDIDFPHFRWPVEIGIRIWL